MGNCFINRTPTGIVDQSFNAFSTNAQSGIAVREAINTIIVDTTYDPLSANAQSGVAVKQAIDALDVTTSGAGTNKTLTTLSQTDGKISATFNNISITKSQVSDFAHTHGNITNGGDITTNVAIASGDRLVINDESASQLNNSSITFGTNATTFLANNGTWQTPSGKFAANTASIVAQGQLVKETTGGYQSATYTVPNDCIAVITHAVLSTYAMGNFYINNVKVWNGGNGGSDQYVGHRLFSTIGLRKNDVLKVEVGDASGKQYGVNYVLYGVK